MKQSDKGIFYFKQFKIHHDRCSHKVGTDSVLLGSWVDLNGSKSVLDIGSGSAILMLMAAQRTNNNVIIDGVEIDKASAQQGLTNITESTWAHRMNLEQSSIQNYQTTKKYDLILSNPPYFRKSFLPPDAKRIISRHDIQLDFNTLIESCDRLSHSKTRLNLILPYSEAKFFIKQVEARRWYVTRQWFVRGRSNKPVERLLLELCKEKAITETGELCLMDSGENWSSQYRELTHEFYLKG